MQKRKITATKLYNWIIDYWNKHLIGTVTSPTQKRDRIGITLKSVARRGKYHLFTAWYFTCKVLRGRFERIYLVWLLKPQKCHGLNKRYGPVLCLKTMSDNRKDNKRQRINNWGNVTNGVIFRVNSPRGKRVQGSFVYLAIADWTITPIFGCWLVRYSVTRLATPHGTWAAGNPYSRPLAMLST